MARPTRDARRRAFNIAHVESGDWIVLCASLLLFIALIANWWVSGANLNAIKFSQFYFVIMLILILATIALVVYPLLEVEAGIRPLPFATAPLFLLIGFVLFLFTIYELGRYQGVMQQSIRPGFGIPLALISCVVYLLGALIKWGSRERRIRG